MHVQFSASVILKVLLLAGFSVTSGVDLKYQVSRGIRLVVTKLKRVDVHTSFMCSVHRTLYLF
jgi:hypothetical protein